MTIDGELHGEPLRSDEIEGFRAALTVAGLPADDVAAADVRAFRFTRGGAPVGYGAFESHGGDVLLRSIVVAPNARRGGIGRWIVGGLLACARRLGAERAYLLTTNARGYFESLGFAGVDRAEAPPAILATRQAAGLCPASAALLTRTTEDLQREP